MQRRRLSRLGGGLMKIGSVAVVSTNAAVAALLKIKDHSAFIALPNELLEKHGVKSFDVIEDKNKIMLIAAATNEINRTTNEVLS